MDELNFLPESLNKKLKLKSFDKELRINVDETFSEGYAIYLNEVSLAKYQIDDSDIVTEVNSEVEDGCKKLDLKTLKSLIFNNILHPNSCAPEQKNVRLG